MSIAEPDMTGIVRSDCVNGIAWKDNSRDLCYALQAGLDRKKVTGELERVFGAHGVTFIALPAP